MPRYKSYDPPPDDEPDAEPYLPEPEPEPEPAAEAETVDKPEQMTATQETNHKQAVTSATGNKQTALISATAAYKAGGTLISYIAAVKSADIAYYQAFIASALANNEPAGGALEALHQLGAG
jgi:hypothetical protein